MCVVCEKACGRSSFIVEYERINTQNAGFVNNLSDKTFTRYKLRQLYLSYCCIVCMNVYLN